MREQLRELRKEVNMQTQKPKLTRKRGAPEDPKKQKVFRRAAAIYQAGGGRLSWTQVARKASPEEFKRDPKGTPGRIRQGAKKYLPPLHVHHQTTTRANSAN
jgi:hypothetical protein